MIQMSKPKRYKRVRDAKKLENFFFDIEQYIPAVRTKLEEDKVVMAAIYLVRKVMVVFQICLYRVPHQHLDRT
ncbi:Uncharacterized protein TCM_039234 [Theobroma cacao]|uniref:Uncharacterized protein n=1 Tax=Theobroma cacao TaxID=3641 RepID=A0A061GQU5_THECC|nr:Uncharacterized protein TCM_039234 [Theobroma cacao]